MSEPVPKKRYVVSAYDGEQLVKRRWPVEQILQETIVSFERLGLRVEVETVPS